jgi:CBS domain-containing protein
MTTDFSTLPIEHITSTECVAKYIDLPQIVHIDDSATDVLLDFKKMKPLTMNKDALMMDAREMMQRENMDFILVQDKNEQLVGVLSLKEILSEHPIKAMETRRVSRDEVLVYSVMTPIEEVHAINVKKLKHAKVGHVIATLKKLQSYFVLVIEQDMEKNNGKKTIRGIFIAAQINRLTGSKIRINPALAKSVAELQKELHH